MKKLSFTFYFLCLISCLVSAQPIADFSVDNNYSCNIPMTVQFTNNSMGNNLSYLWDFADGGTSTQENPTNTYTSYQVYNVCLYIDGDLGLRDTSCQEITLDVNLEEINQTICDGESYMINGVSYQTTGLHEESLEAGAANGCDSLIRLNLVVQNPVISDLNFSLCIGEFVNVNSTIYDETNPSGTEVIINGSFNGCDSIILSLIHI